MLPLADRHGNSAYGLAALHREADDVANAPEGQRNNRLNLAAFRCGQLVAGGELDHRYAVDTFVTAALRCGLSLQEAMGHDGRHGTITSGLTGGMKSPRTRRPS